MFPRMPRSMTKVLTAVFLFLLLTFATTHAGSSPLGSQITRHTSLSYLLAPDDVTITAVKTDSLIDDVNGNTLVDPEDTLEYSIVVSNSGDEDALNTLFTDVTDDTEVTVDGGSLRATPIGTNDTYDVIGNTHITHPVGTGVLVNDLDPDGGTFTASCSPCTSTEGGTVSLNSNGSFTYEPPAGFTGEDTFTYTVTDNHSLTDTGTVTFTVANLIWWVDSNASGAGTGTSTDPFQALASAQTASGTDDIIFIYNRGTAYTGGFAMQDGQKLCGHGANLATCSGLTPPTGTTFPTLGTNPTIANTGGNVVTLAQNNTVMGLTLGNSGGAANFALTGANFGTASIQTVTINTNNGGISLSTGTATASIASLTSTGGTNNINLNAVNGTLNLGSGALSGSSSHAFNVSGGGATINYSGTINNSAATAEAVNIQGKTGGTVTLSGAITSTGAGVNLTSNTSGTIINLTGGLTISTTGANEAFTATGGGTINVTGVANTVSSATGSAVNIANTTIGASGVTFRTVNSNGGANPGIILNNTGTTGNFAVTGTVGGGSGGTIQNKTGNAIQLTTVDGVSLSFMNLTNIDNNGILGTSVTDFSMTGSNLTNIANAADPDEAAVWFNNLQGTNSFTNNTITNAFDDQIVVFQTGAANLSLFTLTGNTFNGHDGDNDAFRYQGYNTTNGTVTIANNDFFNSDGDYVQVTLENSANLNLTVGGATLADGNTFDNTGGFTPLGGGITLSPGGGPGWNGRLDFDIRNNTISDAHVQAITMNLLNPANGATVDGFIRNNTISNSNNLVTGGSIEVVNGSSSSQVTVEISGNTITGDNGLSAIHVLGDQAGRTNNRTDVRVLNNNVSAPRNILPGGNVNAFHLNSSTSSTSTGIVVCLDMQNNTLAGGGFSGTDTRIRQRFSSQVLLPSYGGGANNITDVQNYIFGRGNTGVVSAATSAAPGGYFNGNCNAPTLAQMNAAYATINALQSEVQTAPIGEETAVFTPALPRFTSSTTAKVATPAKLKTVGDTAVLSKPFSLSQESIESIEAAEATTTVGPFTLPAGESTTITFQVVVNDPFPVAQNPTCNQATISGSNFANVLSDDPDLAGSSDPTCTTINIEADLDITKTDGAATAVPGTPITYTITASNAGPYPDAAATVADTFPAAITGVTWTCLPTGAASCTAPSGIGDINQSVNLPVGDSVTFTVSGTIDPAATGSLTNTATVAPSAGLTDPDPANNAATDINTLTPQADLSITKTDSADPVDASTGFSYTLNVTNNGPSTATTVSVEDTLPASVAFVSASGTGWTCGEAAGVVTCTRPTLAPGAAPAITISVTAPAEGGNLSNTAAVSSATTDPVPGNDSDTETTTITPVADLAITKADSADPVIAGAAFSYTLDVTNIGPSTATSVTVVDTLPAGVGFVTASGTGWACGEAAGVVTCTRPTLAVGAAPAITINVTAPAEGGNLSNTATVTAAENDPAAGNNSDTETTAVTAEADLSITKTDGQTTAVPGTTIIYTIVASNAGPSSAASVTVADTFPAVLSGVAWTCVGVGGATCTAAGSGNINDSVNLPAGGSVTYTASGTIDAAATGTLSNTATVSSSVTDPNPANNSATDINTLTPQADLSISKTDGLTAVAPSQLITYTITASNAGPSDAPGSTVADTFPASLTGVTWTCSSAGGGTCTAAGAGDINDSVNLPAGGSVTYIVSATVDAGASGIISNTATVAAPGGVTDPNPGNNSATDMTSIDAPPEITELTVTPSTIDENDTVDLSVTFTDPDTQEAHEVVINWGDGSSDTIINLPIGTLTATADHQYLDDNPTGTPSDDYTVTVTVNEADGGTDSDTAVVTVNNVAPILSGISAPAANENELVTLSGSIADPGTQDTFTLLVNWGDGDSDTYNYPAGTISFDETHQYLDNGSYTISLALTDDDTGSDNDSVNVTVSNVAPTLSNVLITSAINENEVATLSGDITDPGTLDTFTLEVDWGDGMTNTYNYPAGTTSFSETHLYADDDPTGTPSDIKTVSLTLTDNDGGSDSDTTAVTVNNVAPDLFNLAATPLLITETNTITVTGQISDDSPLDTFVLTVDWGDGPDETFNYAAGTTSFLITHTYADDTPAAQRVLLTNFDIELTLTDDDTGSDSETLTVQVDNVPPVLDNITITDPVTEGDTATLSGNIIEVSPADTFTLTVAWGDGVVDSYIYPAGTTGFNASHIFTDDNPTATPSDTYTATLTLVDDDGGTAVSVISFTVNNAPPVADAGTDIAGYPGSAVSFNGSFTDVGIEDTHTIEWDFGDGITSSGSLMPTHVYTATGVYTATLTVTDDDTGVSSDEVVVTISGTQIFLPIVMSNFTSGPDLMVSTLTASGNNIEVVVTNQGNAAVTDDFWVDVYIDPDTVPTMVNQTWPLVGDQGLVWGVTGVTLNPGQSLTLTINGTHYRSDLSSFTAPLAAGTPIYAQVDSANTGTNYGSVLENHESSGGVYNNITATTVQ